MIYTNLGNSGLRVSQMCLGTMSFGTEWGWGIDEYMSRRVFDAYIDAGGNFIDSANRYTEGSSESFLGAFMQGKRQELVMATKYSLTTAKKGVNDGGNHRKNMVQSIEGSLKRLKTDYIDLFYLHAWDFTTPVDEVLRGLDDLVRAGKVLYLGISDTPSWIVSQANTIAQFRGYLPFEALQIEYSLIQRTPERDLEPMVNAFGMSILDWAPLAGGALTGKYLTGEGSKRVPEHSSRRNERSVAITREVMAVADELNAKPSQVALAWIMARPAHHIPLVGASKPEQMMESIAATDISLSTEQIERLNTVSQIELGFPHDFLQQELVRDLVFGGQTAQFKAHPRYR